MKYLLCGIEIPREQAVKMTKACLRVHENDLAGKYDSMYYIYRPYLIEKARREVQKVKDLLNRL